MTPVAFAVAAHPDDIEFLMSGTMMRLKDAGYELHYMNIANGSCGTTQFDTETIVNMRRDEAKEAADFIGAIFHESLTSDLEIFYDKHLLSRLGSIMREVAPEILLVHSPTDYMEDHINACRLAVTASFSRGMCNFPVDPPRDAIANDVTIYHAQPHGNRDGLGRLIRPDIYVDVTSRIEEKTEMLTFHRTQKDWLDTSQGLNSYADTMKQLLREVGQMSETFEYAEGWRKHQHLGFCREIADPLSDAIPGFICFR